MENVNKHLEIFYGKMIKQPLIYQAIEIHQLY